LVGGVLFSVFFRRLFDLVVDKSITIRNMVLLGWGEGGEAWVWRRSLWVWEEKMLAECRLLLSYVSLQSTSPDVWQWLPDPSRGCSVCGVYDMLTTQEHPPVCSDLELIWHK